MSNREYRVRIAEVGVNEMPAPNEGAGHADIAFVLGVDALTDVPVVTGPNVSDVLLSRIESNPFIVNAIDDDQSVSSGLSSDGIWTAIGRLVDVQYRILSGNWITYGTGRISHMGEPDGPGKYAIEISDESWKARRGQVFKHADTTIIWPNSFKATWRGLNPPFPTTVSGTRVSWFFPNFYRIKLSVGIFKPITDKMVRWVSGDVVDDLGANPEEGNFKHLRLNYGGVDYRIVSFGLDPNDTDDIVSMLKEPEISGGPQTQTVTTWAWVYSEVEPPASGQAFLHAPTAPPSADLPLHIGLADPTHLYGTDDGWIHPATLTRRVWDELGLRYNEASLFEMENRNFPLIAPYLNHVPDDPEQWMQDEIWGPFRLLTVRDNAGRRKLIDNRLPDPDDIDGDIESLLVLNAGNTRPGSWQILGREVVTSVTFDYLRQFVWGDFDVPPTERSDPTDTRALDFVASEVRTREPILADQNTIDAVGLKNITLSLKSVLEPNALHRRNRLDLPVSSTVFEDTAQVVARDIFDVHMRGPVKGTVEVDGTVAETLEEGSIVIIDQDSLRGPNPDTGGRSGQRIVRIVQITRWPTHAECEYLDLGQKLTPLAAPTISLQEVVGNKVLVTILGLQEGATAVLELVYTDSSDAPTVWTERRANVGNETITFYNAPDGWVHVRARSTAPNRIRSIWTTEQLQLAAEPKVFNLNVSLDDGGMATVAGQHNTNTEGVRIKYDVHDRADEPNYGNAADYSAADLVSGIGLLNIAEGKQISVEVEPWTNFSGGSVSGTAGPKGIAFRIRPRSDFQFFSEWSRIHNVSSTVTDSLKMPQGGTLEQENGEGNPWHYMVIARIVGTSVDTLAIALFAADAGTWAINKITERGTSGIHPELVIVGNVPSIRLYGETTLQDVEVFYSRALAVPNMDDPGVGVVPGLLANVDLDAITDIDRAIKRVTGFDGEGILARLDGVGSNEILEAAVGTLHMALGAVNEGRLASLAVTYPKLGPGAVRADKMIIGSFDNLIQNPGFETGELEPHSLNPNGGTFSVSSDVPITGQFDARYNPAGQTNDAALRSNGPFGDINAHPSAREGDSFYFEFYGRRRGGGPTWNRMQARIRFRDQNGNDVGNVDGSAVVPSSAVAGQRISVSGVAPAGTVYVFFEVRVLNDGEPGILGFDDLYARQMVTGDLMVDGTITALKIQSISLTTLQATVGQLSALTADMGDVAAGRVRNPANTAGVLFSGTVPGTWTTYMDLTATGDSSVLKVGGNIDVRANGEAFYDGSEFNAGQRIRVGGPAGAGQSTRAQVAKRSDWHTQLTNVVNWSIPNGGTENLGSFADSRGLIVVFNSTEGHVAIFLASANSITLLNDPQGTFDNTKDNAGTINLYFDTGNLGIQNNRPSSATVRIMLIGGEPL